MNPEETIYISLEEATKFCNYSQEYLSLRARQGKLQALKFGRNWVTKKEWLEEYLNKNQKFVNPPENLPVESAGVRPRPIPVLRFGFVVALVFALLVSGMAFGKDSFKFVFETLDPYVIKISQATDLAAKEIFGDAKDFYSGIGLTIEKIGRDFGEGLEIVTTNTNKAIALKVLAVNEGVDNFLADLSQRASEYTYIIGYQTAEIGRATTENLIGYFQWLGDSYFAANEFIEEKISNTSRTVLVTFWVSNDFLEQKLSNYGSQISIIISGGIKGIIQGYWQANDFLARQTFALGEKLKEISQKITQGYFSANNFVEQKFGGLEGKIGQIKENFIQGIKEAREDLVLGWQDIKKRFGEFREEVGIVVVPSTEKDEEVVKKIKESFSDEVIVEPKDETSGIIIPVFKKGVGQQYLYILVPIKSE